MRSVGRTDLVITPLEEGVCIEEVVDCTQVIGDGAQTSGTDGWDSIELDWVVGK